MYKSFKTELKPNNKQRTLFTKNAGAARFTYNWALGLLKEDYESGKKEISAKAIPLHKVLNSKKEFEYPWMYECSKWSMQNALINLEKSYDRFFKKISNFPKFKKKGKKDSFTVNNPIHVYDGKIQLPKIGKVRLKEKSYIPKGEPKSATISLKANRWFVSVQYEIKPTKTKTIDGSIGIDLGIKTFAVFSDGTQIKTENKLKQKERQLKHLQRKISRQELKSNSRKKTKIRLQKSFFKISNSRKDLLHKTTSLLTKTKLEKTIVIEDLNISGMSKNHNLAKSILNIGAYEFRRQLQYKCLWYGKELIVADRFFPSSKLCSNCFCIKNDLKLSDRFYSCNSCGFGLDRDLNAAINLKNYTVRHTGINASGDDKVHSIDEYNSSMEGDRQ